MKCYALMIHDDGSAMVGECSPEMGEQMMSGGQMQEVASLEEGLVKLGEMAGVGEGQKEAESRGFAEVFESEGAGMGGMGSMGGGMKGKKGM